MLDGLLLTKQNVTFLRLEKKVTFKTKTKSKTKKVTFFASISYIFYCIR